MTAIPSEARHDALRGSAQTTASVEPTVTPLPRPTSGLVPWLLRRPLVVDALLLVPIFIAVSLQARIGSLQPIGVALLAVAVTVGVARRMKVYTIAATDTPTTTWQRCVAALAVSGALFLLATYVTSVDHDRRWLPLAAAGALGAMSLHRLVLFALSSHRRTRALVTNRIALLGEADSIAEFDKLEHKDPRRIVVHRTPLETSGDIRPALREVDQIIGLVHEGRIDRVLVLATAPGIPVVNAVVRRCSMAGVGVDLLTGAARVRPGRLEIGQIHGFSAVHIQPGLHGRGRLVTKRIFDLVIASVALLLLSPLMVAVTAAVKLGSRGPAFYKQRRLGRGGKQFEMIKFRSMLPGADQMILDLTDQNEADGPLFKMKDDPRVTGIGRFIRRSSIDELPQLWNVIRGDMSLVGPRPAIASEADGWPIELFDRLDVSPGITGLWQVSGRSNASFADYERLDLYYVDNWTLGLDIAILVRTVPALLGRGAY